MQTGRLAKQAAGSAVVQFGETVVLAAITVSDTKSPLPFFPLTVEYREKTYAAGKFPGGFIKREGRPSDDEILAARQIDRSLRPLFPKGFKNETQVYVYVISADQENDADTVALTAASLALSVSKVPWDGPVAAVRMGRIDGEFIVNPTFEQLDESDLDLVVAGRKGSIMMVEGGALEIGEDDMAQALGKAQEAIEELLEIEHEIADKVNPTKMEWTKDELPEGLEERVRKLAEPKMAEALFAGDKAGRAEAVAALKREVKDALLEEFPDAEGAIGSAFGSVEADVTRAKVLNDGERVDGRDTSTVRAIETEVGLLPRCHGSALFQRGE
ncbi:MAG: polyribonucleotide nucleotidyltransferase, partial [Gemmatimonadota bacterium]|nr:polyribonucleotide nucleotidyltransferase [Gemmatimonadota bacterium]